MGGMGRAILCERVCMCSLSRSGMFNSFRPTRLLCPWDFIGKNTGAGCHFPPPRDLPDPEIKPTSPMSTALAGGFFITAPPGSNLRQDSNQCTLLEENPDDCVCFLWPL